MELAMEEADVVVIGSGAAGLSAALAASTSGARVLVLEASSRYGGATAVSGGQVWAPANHRMAEIGLDDSLEAALTYCEAAAPGRDRGLVETFLRSVPAVVRSVENLSPIRFAPVPDYPDTFAELPGGRTARHVEARPVPVGDLGPLDDLLWPAPFAPPVLTYQEGLESRLFIGGSPPIELIRERLSEGVVTLGAGLVVGLLHACRQASVTLIRGCRAERLLQDRQGRVVGVEARREGSTRPVRAGGVVLATGGFEHDSALRRRQLSGPLTHPVTPPVLFGDGLRMAGRAGAQLAYTGEFWSWPVCQEPGRCWPDTDATARPQLAWGERSLPHVLWVNTWGNRFVNETSHNCAAAFGELDPSTHRLRNLPAWAVGDAQFRGRYPVAGTPPASPLPDWLPQAASVRDLAGSLGVDAAVLERTVSRFNAMAARGRDEDFQRGQSRYERAMGDPDAPHPNLGPVCEPPFFALPVHPGAVGTKGGPLTDAAACWTGRARPSPVFTPPATPPPPSSARGRSPAA
jgi:succinate dehydrogenase/fumarate reductase flavoprotein subunit